MVEWPLSATSAAARQGREFLREVLCSWHLEPIVDAAELLASELIANVVAHVHAPMTLRAELLDDALRIEVDDPSPDPPVVMHPTDDDEHERGMLLIATLADAWGAQHRVDNGKTVWFRLDLGTTPWSTPG